MQKGAFARSDGPAPVQRSVGTSWFPPRYRFRELSRDVGAGATVAAVAVPQAMAYALIAGVPPEYAIYTAIIPTLIASLLGSSSHLIYGPTNALSLLVFSATGAYEGANRLEVVFLLTVLVGVVQVLIALLRLGDLTRYVSESVLLGFLAGAALLVALGQVENLLGLRHLGSAEHHPLYRLWLTVSAGGPVNARAVVIGIMTVLLILALQAVGRRLRFEIPSMLLSLIVAAAFAWSFGWTSAQGQASVPVVGVVPQRLPWPRVPDATPGLIGSLSGSALAIAFLGMVESLAIGKSIAAQTRQRLDYNRQCFAEGMANMGGGIFLCIPGGGSLTRSAINFQAGAATRVSGLLSAVVVAAVLLLFAPLARYVPRAALAGILFVTAWRIVDRQRLVDCLRATRADAATVLVTAGTALFINIEFSILVGTFLSFLFFVPRAAKLQAHELVVGPGRLLRERQPDDPQCTRMALFSLEGEMFFGAAPELDDHLDELRRRADDGARIIMLRVKRARNPDVVCMERLRHFVGEMHGREIVVIFCGVRKDFADVLANMRSERWLAPEHLFLEEPTVGSSTLHAVRYAYRLLGDDRCPTCPGPRGDDPEHGDWHYAI